MSNELTLASIVPNPTEKKTFNSIKRRLISDFQRQSFEEVVNESRVHPAFFDLGGTIEFAHNQKARYHEGNYETTWEHISLKGEWMRRHWENKTPPRDNEHDWNDYQRQVNNEGLLFRQERNKFTADYPLTWQQKLKNKPIHEERSLRFLKEKLGSHVTAGQLPQLLKQHPDCLMESKYLNFKGVPSRPFLPVVPKVIREIIQKRLQAAGYEVEVPLEGSFWEWIAENPALPLIVTEGAKKALCALSHGIIALALPGVCNGFSTWTGEGENRTRVPVYLVATMLPFIKGRTGRIDIAFDQDTAVVSRKNVTHAEHQFCEAILKDNPTAKLFFPFWKKEDGKGLDDLVAAVGIEAFETALNEAVDFETWLANQLDALNYLPTVVVNQRYLNVEIPESARFVALRSLYGTGKTTLVGAEVRKARAEGQKIIVPTHRISLANKIAADLGLVSYNVYKEETDVLKKQALRERMDKEGFVLVINSLHEFCEADFRPSEFETALVFIDEVEQFIRYLLDSDTCKKNRVTLIENLSELLTRVLSPNSTGRVIIADADLSDRSINFVRGAAGDVDPYLVVNRYRSDSPYPVYPVATKEAFWKGVEGSIADGKRLYVFFDSQADESKYSTSAAAKYFAKLFPNLKILIADSDTAQRKDNSAYGLLNRNDLDDHLAQFDLVIVSPYILSGVSIDRLGLFDEVWACFGGTITVDSACQALIRVRDQVPPRYIFAADRSHNRIGRGEFSVDRLITNLFKSGSAQIQSLRNLGLVKGDIDGGFAKAALRVWAEYACQDNRDGFAYRKAIFGKLTELGHAVHETEVVAIDAATTKAVKEERKTSRQQVLDSWAERIPAADDITLEQKQLLEAGEICVPDPEATIRKYVLRDKYRVEVTSDLVELDRMTSGGKTYYKSVQTAYFYSQEGRVFLGHHDRDKLSLKAVSGRLWAPDLSDLQIGVIEYLDKLNVQEFVEKGVFEPGDKSITVFANKIKTHSEEFQLRYGKHPDKFTSQIELISKVLREIGLKLGQFERKRVNGKLTYSYRIESSFLATKVDPIADLRFSIFEGWTKKYRDIQAKREVVSPVQLKEAPVVVEEPETPWVRPLTETEQQALAYIERKKEEAKNPPAKLKLIAVAEQPEELNVGDYVLQGTNYGLITEATSEGYSVRQLDEKGRETITHWSRVERGALVLANVVELPTVEPLPIEIVTSCAPVENPSGYFEPGQLVVYKNGTDRRAYLVESVRTLGNGQIVSIRDCSGHSDRRAAEVNSTLLLVERN